MRVSRPAGVQGGIRPDARVCARSTSPMFWATTFC